MTDIDGPHGMPHSPWEVGTGFDERISEVAWEDKRERNLEFIVK